MLSNMTGIVFVMGDSFDSAICQEAYNELISKL